MIQIGNRTANLQIITGISSNKGGLQRVLGTKRMIFKKDLNDVITKLLTNVYSIKKNCVDAFRRKLRYSPGAGLKVSNRDCTKGRMT